MQGKTRQTGQFQREKENFPDPELMWVTARLREKETFPELELMWVTAREEEWLREKELASATVRARVMEKV